jgi:alkylhydroperoxidase/carboxymuconolactone decarboxylase family protein YurZ
MDRLDPEFMAYLRGGHRLIYADGALPAKFKLLLAMAFDAAQGAESGVRALACQALAAGATRAEIAETLRVAFQLTGIGTIYTASHALKGVLEEEPAPAEVKP